MASVAAGILLPVGIDLLKTEVIPWLVRLVDHVVGGKTAAAPNAGAAVKFPLVSNIVHALDGALVAMGQAMPSSSATIDGSIQAAVTGLQAVGALTGPTTVVTSAPGIGPAVAPAATAGSAVDPLAANALLSSVLALLAKSLGPR